MRHLATPPGSVELDEMVEEFKPLDDPAYEPGEDAGDGVYAEK